MCFNSPTAITPVLIPTSSPTTVKSITSGDILNKIHSTGTAFQLKYVMLFGGRGGGGGGVREGEGDLVV